MRMNFIEKIGMHYFVLMVLCLSEQLFQTNMIWSWFKSTFWDRSLFHSNLQSNNIDIPMLNFSKKKSACMYLLPLSPLKLIQSKADFFLRT